MASKPIPKMILCKGHNTPFLKCTGNKKETDYYMTRSIFAQNGKVCYCKSCTELIFNYYLEQGSLMSSVYYTCQKLDVPFIMECFQELIEVKEADEDGTSKRITKNYIGRYMTILNSKKDRNMLWRDFSDTDVDISEIDSKLKTREVKKKELEKFQLDWGYQEENDYFLLEYFFEELTEMKPLTKPQEMLYRDLCLARLAKRKAEKANDSDVQKIQKQILDLMAKLKIDNFSENKELSIVERTLEARIAIQEKEKPAYYFEDLKRNQDYLGRGKYFYDHIYRPFKNILQGSKLYDIVEEDKDFVSDDDYEEIMENGLERKGDE